MTTCHLCPADDNAVPEAEILDHLRVVHPDAYGEGPASWPDGELVVVDDTVTAIDFEARP